MTALDLPITDIDLTHLGEADPYPLYARLRREAPVRRTPLGAWLLTSHADVRLVQVDERFRSGVDAWPVWPVYAESFLGGVDGPIARMFTYMFVFMDGADHDRMRGLFRRSFTPRVVERLRDAVQLRVDGLVDAADDRGHLEVMSELALPLTIGVICDLLGVPEPDREMCRGWADIVREAFGPPPPPGRLAAMEAAVTASAAYFQDLVGRRRDHPGDDLLSALAVADSGDRMSAEEIAATAILLFGAGHETSAALIGNGLHALLTHPEQHELLASQPALLPTAVEEMLRHDAPFQYMRKFTGEDVTLSGVDIPAGEMVIPIIGAANRDPARFSDPDRLDITRGDQEHVSFGTGMHHCLGAQLARLEAKIVIDTLLRRWPTFAMAPAGAQRPPSAGSLRLLDFLHVHREA